MRSLLVLTMAWATTVWTAPAYAQEYCDGCGQALEACTCFVPNRYFAINIGSSYEQFDSVFDGPFVYDYSDGGAIQFRLGQRLHRFVAAELQFESAGGHELEGRIMWLGTHPSTLTLDTDASIWSATANLKLIAAFWGVEPYVVIGGGVLGGSIHSPGLVDIEGTGPMIRAGVGLDMPLYGNHFLNTEWSTSIPFGDAEPFEHQALTVGLGWWF